MTNTLFIDTATTSGKWEWKLPELDTAQPHMIRIAAILQDDEGNEIERFGRLVRPIPGWRAVDSEATRIHGIYQHDLNENGMALGAILAQFSGIVAKSDIVVAHNIAFHHRVVKRAYRDGQLMPPEMNTLRCTMRGSADLVQIEMQNGRWKWPSLVEAFRHFASEALSLPSDPIERGFATVEAVRRVHQGIMAAQ